MNQAVVQDVVAEVMKRLADRRSGAIPSSHYRPATGVRAGEDAPANQGKAADRAPAISVPVGQHGVFSSVDQAVAAATEAQKKLVKLPMSDRDAIVNLVKRMAKENAQSWGKIELDETKIGRLDHKIEKLQILELVPGVEFLKTGAQSGSDGLCLHEYAPFGVIGIITPVTHSVPTLTANVINMVASGNSIVANPHPSGANCAAIAVREYNRQIAQKYGIDHLITCVIPPTLESAEAI